VQYQVMLHDLSPCCCRSLVFRKYPAALRGDHNEWRQSLTVTGRIIEHLLTSPPPAAAVYPATDNYSHLTVHSHQLVASPSCSRFIYHNLLYVAYANHRRLNTSDSLVITVRFSQFTAH